MLGYEKDESGRRLARIRFFGQQDFFEPAETTISPRKLRPYKPPRQVRPPKRSEREKVLTAVRTKESKP